MTEDQMREAMLEDAKAIRKRTQTRDGQTQSLKQNVAVDYNMGGRDSKPETKQIITKKSGHYIHFTEPNLVVNAIKELVEKYKNSK